MAYPSFPNRKRLRPSTIRLFFSGALGIATLAVGLILFNAALTAVFIAFACLSLAALSLFRIYYIANRLPQPYGRGSISYLRERQAIRQGLLLVLLGIAVIFLPYLAIVLFPSPLLIAASLGLVMGAPLTEVVRFFWIHHIESISSCLAFSVTDIEEGDAGETVLVKSIELTPD